MAPVTSFILINWFFPSKKIFCDYYINIILKIIIKKKQQYFIKNFEKIKLIQKFKKIIIFFLFIFGALFAYFLIYIFYRNLYFIIYFNYYFI